MVYEYGEPILGAALGGRKMFTGDPSWEEGRWEPSVPEDAATLWRYMSFAKFCSLLGRREVFFALVGDMEDKYEGFISPPTPRDFGDPLQEAERNARKLLHLCARSSLVSCWTESEHESSLMWKAYAGSEGVAIRTSFQRLRESINLVAELPVTFGRVEYADYTRQEVSRFGFAPLFHKRMEYRGEGEIRAVLPCPPVGRLFADSASPETLDIRLDPDVAEQRGRYVPVNLEILVGAIVLPPDVKPWFAEVVESVTNSSPVKALVTRSLIDSTADYGI